MSRMTESQRAQYERPDLTVPTTGVRVRSSRPLLIYTVVVSIVLAVLVYASIRALDGWAQWVVLGAIVMTAIGTMIAVSPHRRG